MTQKDQKIREIIRELAAGFFSKESNRQSLITVTDVELSNKGGKAVILFTVLPEDKEKEAAEFMGRRLSDFRQHVIDNSRLGRIPYFEVRPDYGEKNRQRIDDISKKL